MVKLYLSQQEENSIQENQIQPFWRNIIKTKSYILLIPSMWDIKERKLLLLNEDQIDHPNRPITPKEIEGVIDRLLTKKKHRTRWFQCRILSDLQRLNPNTLQTFPPNRNRRNTTQLLLRSHYHADTKTTQRSN